MCVDDIEIVTPPTVEMPLHELNILDVIGLPVEVWIFSSEDILEEKGKAKLAFWNSEFKVWL